MSSQAKINANRENAKHSTGPRTEQGKARSSFNATRHGLTGQVHVTTEDERTARATHSEAFFKDLRPLGATEYHLVQMIADKQWQIHRADAWLDSIFALGEHELADEIDTELPQVHAALTAGLVTIARAKEIDLMGRYSSRLQRDFHKALAELKKLQAGRKQKEKQEMQEAPKIAKFCKMKGEPYNPAAFGFVSRISQIEINAHRADYLKQSEIAAKYDFNREKYEAATA